MAKKPNKNVGKGISNVGSSGSSANLMSRPDFLKSAGVAAAGVGAAAVGLGGIGKAQFILPSSPPDVDGPEGGGSLIGAVRLDPKQSYVDVPGLLYQHISGSAAAWDGIKDRIDYTYECLHHALKPLLLEGNPPLKEAVLSEVNSGKKLLLKINAILPTVLDLPGDGSPGQGLVVCTDWTVVAALLRWFHDKLGITYHQMAVGEAGSFVTPNALFIGCTPEGLLEGVLPLPVTPPANYYVGYPFYFVRKYLAETHDGEHTDDPMNGYWFSLTGNRADSSGYPKPDGNYVPPGVRPYLSLEDLNNAEAFVPGGRGRQVQVPDGGDNFSSIVLHKAIVGDGTPYYPGCVLVNVPKMKMHVMTTHTICMKNLGIGGYPITSGEDDNQTTFDWFYSYPGEIPPGCSATPPCSSTTFPPCIKQRVPHSRFHFDLDEDALPIPETLTDTAGMDGSMIDINLAINSQVPVRLHVVDGINAINLEPVGSGIPTEEGLLLASDDPVALDLFCVRYLFKNLPKAFGFARGVPIPVYEPNYPPYPYGAIITEPGADWVLSRATTFQYAQGRGLGNGTYYIEGKDRTTKTNASLVSQGGHFGKIEHNLFEELLANGYYFGGFSFLWHMQPTTLAYAQATDALTGSNYISEFMALDENTDGMIDFSEVGDKGAFPVILGLQGIQYNMMVNGELMYGIFHFLSHMIKYSLPLWNSQGKDPFGIFIPSYAATAAMEMANGPEVPGETIDMFFGVPYGTGGDGMAKWPSLQFARYIIEMSLLYTSAYDLAYAHAAAGAGPGFTLYVPNSVPYVPLVPTYPNYGAFWGAILSGKVNAGVLEMWAGMGYPMPPDPIPTPDAPAWWVGTQAEWEAYWFSELNKFFELASHIVELELDSTKPGYNPANHGLVFTAEFQNGDVWD